MNETLKNETLHTLRTRRSIRRYEAQQITEAELEAILDAGTWAASGKGMQSAVMVVLQREDQIAPLRSINARIMGNPAADPFYGAPTVVAVLADSTSPNWEKDGSLVLGNLMNAAASVGVGSCWINRCRETFDLPEGREIARRWGLGESFRGVGYCILGYPAGDIPAPKPRKEGYILRP